VPIEERGPGVVRVRGVGLDGLRSAGEALDCGNSGTSIRLLSGLLSGQRFRSHLTGDEYLQARPMRRVAEPLKQMGAFFEGQVGTKAGEIYPPLLVGGGGERLRGIHYQSKVASAQVKSAVLLAALQAEGPTTFTEPVVSRDHTERMLAFMGAPISRSDDGLTSMLDPTDWDRRLSARDLEVPGDLSSAAFLLGAATLVSGSRIVVRGVGVNPTRTGFLDALARMGGRVEQGELRDQNGEPVADLTCVSASLVGIEIAGELAVRAIDELPLLAAVAAHAEGETRIADAAELRVKESDRIAATAAMLRAFGVEVEEHPDGLTIVGRGPMQPGRIDSRGDHRIAMAGAICALAVAGDTLIHDTTNIATSFPTFQASLAKLGVDLNEG
jgi:3-phosphoshikimate 1-carboxyvinyltransferase